MRFYPSSSRRLPWMAKMVCCLACYAAVVMLTPSQRLSTACPTVCLLPSGCALPALWDHLQELYEGARHGSAGLQPLPLSLTFPIPDIVRQHIWQGVLASAEQIRFSTPALMQVARYIVQQTTKPYVQWFTCMCTVAIYLYSCKLG